MTSFAFLNTLQEWSLEAPSVPAGFTHKGRHKGQAISQQSWNLTAQEAPSTSHISFAPRERPSRDFFWGQEHKSTVTSTGET
jgi:hypothetical protein